jgi:hypothetical protein
MFALVNGKLGDPIVMLPLPVVIFAMSHAGGTAATAGIMTKQRQAVKLVNSAGRLQYEQFLSHYML